MVKSYLSHNPACQKRRSITDAFCHSRLQTRITRVLHWIHERARGADNGDDSCAQPSSRNSPVHILPTSSSKSAPKSSRLLTFFEMHIGLSTQSCALFCRQLSPIEPATAETETLLRRPRTPHADHDNRPYLGSFLTKLPLINCGSWQFSGETLWA